MPIRVRPLIDPLNPGGFDAVIASRCEASRVLEQELLRYCNEHIQGRSFLIAGHRGAGKTTMVADVIHRVCIEARKSGTVLRPFPVVLHGPSLFLALSELPDEDRDADDDSEDSQPDVSPASEGAAHESQVAANGENHSTTSGQETQDVLAKIAKGLCDAFVTNSDKKDASKGSDVKGVEKHAQRALEQIILGLHRAVAREYADGFRRWVLSQGPDGVPADSRDGPADAILIQNRLDWPELAAQFEIELMEDPPAARLRQFYASVGALASGILAVPLQADGSLRADQGARELVALNGICMAHQRISGELSERDENSSSDEHEERSEAQSGFGNGKQLKPLAAVFSGAVVTGGAAAGQYGLLTSALLGLATTLGAFFTFSRSSTSVMRRERTIDRTFIPDLSLRTLDRILPTLLMRLINAGLAPVLVIDELDKMGQLSWRLEAMVRHLKKLMAENVFTCFLTDRGYLELMTLKERDKAYGKTFSYFSHPLFVNHEPGDLDAYMSMLFDTAGDRTTEIDADLLKWVLRHRSEMHALALNREIAALRDATGQIVFGADVRSSLVYTIDLSFEVAIEYRLNQSDVANWLKQRPRMRLTLNDALFYISRQWRRGEKEVNFDDAGVDRLWRDLEKRMNLDEVRRRHRGGTGNGNPEPDVLIGDDRKILLAVVLDLARELSAASPAFKQSSRSAGPSRDAATGRAPVPQQWVLDSVLDGEASVLERVKDFDKRFRFRYYQSGMVREPDQPPPMVGPPAPTAGAMAASAAVSSSSTGALAPGVAPHPEASTAPQAETQPALSKMEQLERLSNASRKTIEFIDGLEAEISNLVVVLPAVSKAGLVYQLLSDQFGILPTSPGWMHVQEAKVRLDQALYTQPDPADARRDLDSITEFAAMIRRNVDLIGATLIAATAIGSLGAESIPAVCTFNGLRALSEGLKFREMDVDGVRLVLRHFQKDLTSAIPEFSLIDSLGSFDRDAPGPAIVDAVKICSNLAVKSRSDVQDRWDGIIERAWLNFGAGPGGDLLPELNRPARFELILCAATLTGPAKFFTIDPFSPPLEDWTNALREGFAAAPANLRKSDELPPGIFARALRMLGFNLLNPALLEAFIQSLLAENPRWSRFFNDGLAGIAGIAAPSTASKFRDEVVVYVRTLPSSPTFGWTAPQIRETLAVCTVEALRDPPPRFIELLTLTRKIRIRWETGVTDKDREAIRGKLASTGDQSTTIVEEEVAP